jgi:hypothetical protein
MPRWFLCPVLYGSQKLSHTRTTLWSIIMVGRRMMATAEPPLLPPFPQKNEGSSPGEASEGDGRQVATLAGIAARQVPRLVADGRSEHDNPRGGNRHATEAVNALDCSDGRGIAGAMTTTTMGGHGDDDVEAVVRFARTGRR